jgi:hypothetical protein
MGVVLTSCPGALKGRPYKIRAEEALRSGSVGGAGMAVKAARERRTPNQRR